MERAGLSLGADARRSDPRRARPARRRTRAGVLLAVLLTVALVATACSRGPAAGERARPAPEPRPKLTVLATIFPLYEFTRVVGGDRVEAGLLLPPGVEAHDFDPSPRDIERIARADLFLYNGAGFEPWVDRVLEAAQASGGVRGLDATATIALLDVEAEVVGPAEDHGHDLGHDHDQGHDYDAEHDDHVHVAIGRPDPHVWLDPRRAAQQVEGILRALVELDPEGEAVYAANARAYLAELEALDAEFVAGLRDCARWDLVVQHAAFGYLARRYGLHQVAISGVTPEMEPTPRQLADLVAFARERGVRAIYYEALVDSRVAETLAAEVGAEALLLHPLENLTAGDSARGETYLSLMRQNLVNLRRGLGCGGP